MNVLRQKSLHDSALTYFPHFESTISQELSIEVFSRHERGFRNTKQREHLTLQIRELDVERLYDFVALDRLFLVARLNKCKTCSVLGWVH